MKMNDFMKKKRKVYTNARTLCLFLFELVMILGCVLGLLGPLRPKQSDLEKRELASFPTFSLAGVLDGSYFSDISLWYSDTFPLRDVWMSGNQLVKNLYGIKTKQVISGNHQGADEIPVVPAETEEPSAEQNPSEESQGQTQTSGTATVPEQSSGETLIQTQSFAPEITAPETQASAAPPAALVLPTNDPNYVVEPITGQKLNGMYIEGNRAYAMYFFNLEAANTYINVVNRTAQALEGKSNVYTLLIPNSEAFYLTNEQRVQIEPDWRNEEDALRFYAASFHSSVKNVPVYEALLPHKDEYIFFRTDHHWNGIGSYYAYAAWAQTKGVPFHTMEEYQRMEFPGFLGSYYAESQSPVLEAAADTVIAFVPLTHNRMVYVNNEGGQQPWPIINDVSQYRASQKYSCYAAGDNPFSYIENPNVQNGEICVVIKESYADAFIPYLTDHYQYIYWFDYRSYNGSIMQFIQDVNPTDVLFVNGLDPISSISSMNRLESLMQ